MRKIIGDVQELISVIGHLTRSEAEQIARRAEEKAEQILLEAGERAEEINSRILREAEDEADQIRRRRIAQSARTAQQEYLRERESILDEVWRKAEDRLRTMVENGAEYAEALHRLALMGARILGPGELLLFSEAKGQKILTEERLRNWSTEAARDLKGDVSFRLSDAPAATWGGLIVQKKGWRIDATFPVRLSLARDEIREKIVELILAS